MCLLFFNIKIVDFKIFVLASVPQFSAVCWMFGRRLYDLYGIPLGLINTNYPGSCVEAWSSPETNSLCNGRY